MSSKEDAELHVGGDTREATSEETPRWPDPDGPLLRSEAAYLRELPELLETHPKKWVAFADGKRLRIGDTHNELWHLCLVELALPHERFVVRRIVPDSGPEVESFHEHVVD